CRGVLLVVAREEMPGGTVRGRFCLGENALHFRLGTVLPREISTGRFCLTSPVCIEHVDVGQPGPLVERSNMARSVNRVEQIIVVLVAPVISAARQGAVVIPGICIVVVLSQWLHGRRTFVGRIELLIGASDRLPEEFIEVMAIDTPS